MVKSIKLLLQDAAIGRHDSTQIIHPAVMSTVMSTILRKR
jgi:hypothetical protein